MTSDDRVRFGHEIEQWVKENPDDVNEVPIQPDKFGRNIVFGNNFLLLPPEFDPATRRALS